MVVMCAKSTGAIRPEDASPGPTLEHATTETHATVGETCNSEGECKVPDPTLDIYKLDCDDGNPCTHDRCDPLVGCIHTNISGPCHDNDPCSVDGSGYCRAGQCITETRDCDDGNPCTIDSCNPAGGCFHTIHHGSCEDGDLCTVNESCVDGLCVGGVDRDCDDDNLCTIDSCDPRYGCIYAPSGAKTCDDKSACTINDRCDGQICFGDHLCEDTIFAPTTRVTQLLGASSFK